MISEILLSIAAIKFFCWLTEHAGVLGELWGNPEIPAEYSTELSNTDKAKILATKNIISYCFGSDVTSSFKNASNIQRINMAGDFANMLAYEYGLNINIDVVCDDVHRCGYYNHAERKAVFNIAQIASANSERDFASMVRETIDTIIHELRHAVQHEAVDNPGFWDVDTSRISVWADNMNNYISPEVDMRGYASQPIEKDAVTFAAAAMKGVF